MQFIIRQLGADCSFYQDDDFTLQKIDFAKMRAAGAEFVILRGGQNTWADEDFRDYVAEAKKHFAAWGSYWFYDSRSSPVSQARLWKSACGTDIPKVIFVDLEESYGGQYGGESNWKAFVKACETEFPSSRVVIYSANWWWSSQTINDPAFWAKYPLWVAGYNTNPADVVLPAPWRNTQAHIWQYTDKGDGNAFGVESSRIDLNYFNAIYDFEIFWGVTVTPPTNGEPMPALTHYYKMTSTKPDEVRRIRAYKIPNIDGAQIGQISVGNFALAYSEDLSTDAVKYTTDFVTSGSLRAKAGDVWRRVFEANNRAVDGWVAEIHLGVRYLNKVEYGSPPISEPPPVNDFIEKVMLDVNGAEIGRQKYIPVIKP